MLDIVLPGPACDDVFCVQVERSCHRSRSGQSSILSGAITMKRLPVVPLVVLLLGAGALIPVFAKAPEELKKVPVADLAAEVNEQIEAIGMWTESPAAYKDRQDDIRRSAGVLATLGQAIGEHPEGKTQKLSAPGLRVAALKLVDSQDYESAAKAIKALRAAAAGQAPNPEPRPSEWRDLIDMDDMMQVINTRNSQIRRAARRSRDPEADSRDALTVAMLSLVMEQQAEDYLSEEADIAAWKKYSKDFQRGMIDLAAAFKAKDKAGIEKHLDFATKACNDCHAQFRDQE
jgi:hypothetical protein